MVASSPQALDATFHALAHPTRRAMLAMLADGEHTVGELAAPFDASLAACSKHLQVLEHAQLVERRILGRTHACRLRSAPLQLVADFTEAFRAHWDPAFARLDTLLHELQPEPKKPGTEP